MDNFPKCQVNNTALTPLTFLKRAAVCYADRTSVIYESTRFTWRQTHERCRRLASSLRALNISRNDVVSVLAPNIPAMYEMHFAVPMAGGVLNTINTRLDANNIAIILSHSEAKLLFVDYEFASKATQALQLLKGRHNSSPTSPLLILINDINSPTRTKTQFGNLDYEQLVQKGDPNYVAHEIKNELDPIALNYTSGTTSAPKGVVYTHRGAYLSTLNNILSWAMGNQPVYLWTLPMFHGNGWGFPWGVAARGGTNVCLRYILANDIYKNISLHHVTHMCCAPIVFTIMLEARGIDPGCQININPPVEILTAGSPPPATLLQQIESIGFHVTHSYGLTESQGATLVCEWKHEWNQLPKEEQSKLKSLQGVGSLILEDFDVKDMDTMESVPRDGKTMGEIVLRGSGIMKGYFKDNESTLNAFKNGWFHTGDVGVVHKDGYIQIKDRSKDVIISGGENISSVEVESVLYKHPRVLEAAVVAMPHPKWGESPCAFVALKKKDSTNCDVSEDEIIAYCRENLPHYMVPKVVKFVKELPKTSTGKVQKFELRAKAKEFVVLENLKSKNKNNFGKHGLVVSRL